MIWSLSFHHLAQRNPAAADLLRMCAFLEPDTIPEELLQEGYMTLGSLIETVEADMLAFHAACEELSYFSLVPSRVRRSSTANRSKPVPFAASKRVWIMLGFTIDLKNSCILYLNCFIYIIQLEEKGRCGEKFPLQVLKKEKSEEKAWTAETFPSPG